MSKGDLYPGIPSQNSCHISSHGAYPYTPSASVSHLHVFLNLPQTCAYPALNIPLITTSRCSSMWLLWIKTKWYFKCSFNLGLKKSLFRSKSHRRCDCCDCVDDLEHQKIPEVFLDIRNALHKTCDKGQQSLRTRSARGFAVVHLFFYWDWVMLCKWLHCLEPYFTQRPKHRSQIPLRPEKWTRTLLCALARDLYAAL